MAGHSKWANIKHRKARQDAKRGKIYTKLIRELTVAAKAGGGDPNDNPRLRLALDKANSENMPKDTINRAIERGTGAGEAGNLEEITYEGYGPGGVAVLVEAMTDNRNRTVADVRHAFTKFGGNLGTDGSVSYLFNKIGLAMIEKNQDEDAVMEILLDFDGEDLEDTGDNFVATVPPQNLSAFVLHPAHPAQNRYPSGFRHFRQWLPPIPDEAEKHVLSGHPGSEVYPVFLRLPGIRTWSCVTHR